MACNITFYTELINTISHIANIMHNLRIFSSIGISVLLVSIFTIHTRVDAIGIGVCYGRLGDNLPPPNEVVQLFQTENIAAMRIYDPNPDVLAALANSGIQLLIGTFNQDLQPLAQSPQAARDSVATNIVPHLGRVTFRYIAVGNEVLPGELAQYVLPAMQNMQDALNEKGLQTLIEVSTSLSMAILGPSFPPSVGAFADNVMEQMSPIVRFLVSNGSPLLLNVYPYFSYKDNSADVSLSYSLFTSPEVVVQDRPFAYGNMFDAMVDAVYAAMEKVGGAGVPIVVSEIGWPSLGDFGTSAANAQTYNQNLIAHIGLGTPRRNGVPLEAYLFALFNENQKTGLDTERNFGLFYPDKTPVYPITFKPNFLGFVLAYSNK